MNERIAELERTLKTCTELRDKAVADSDRKVFKRWISTFEELIRREKENARNKNA
jgi:hypothetical protein|tara:strand:+ start:494 stop:658 length:165 start_codon:yes stop_codon:yes gene_type:complete